MLPELKIIDRMANKSLLLQGNGGAAVELFFKERFFCFKRILVYKEMPMGLRFIIGRAGSGKSTACLEEIKKEIFRSQEGSSLILLVPEQATFQNEYRLAADPELGGTVRVQVLSFRRLAYRVLQEAGGAVRAHIGELGKRMALRRILEQRRSELKIFHRAAKQPGFADSLAGMLGELKLYRVQPADLKKSGEKLVQEPAAGGLPDKLHDLNLLYGDLEEFLEGRFTDPNDYLNLLAERLERSLLLREAELYIDGFTGFTPQEFYVIQKMLPLAKRLTVALCFDPALLSGGYAEADVFHPTLETYHTLREMAESLRVPVEPVIAFSQEIPARFMDNRAVAHLERSFFSRPAAGLPEEKGVKLAACANRRAEVEAAARELTRLARDQGLRWRDMVVMVRDLQAYHHLVSTIFQDYGIPFFIDQKRTVDHHPLVELIRSALEVVLQNWAYDPVFRYLKTDLVPVGRDEVDRLENYVLAHGIRGSRWTDDRPWTYCRRYTLGEDREPGEQERIELERINQIRSAAAGHLKEFARAMAKAGAVREMTTALFELLDRLDIAGQLEQWAGEAEEKGRLTEAKEHAQIWNNVVQLLDEIVETLGEETLTLEEYDRILDTGLESLKLGIIPPGLDQVVVGTLQRSRNPDVKAALVLGVNDGVLPARTVEEGLLSDLEREQLQELGIRLAPGSRRKLLDEQYLVYIALTRASQCLWISYPQADDEGKGLHPSWVIHRMKELLPNLKELSVPVEPPHPEGEMDFIASPGRSLSYLASMLREMKAGKTVDSLWLDVYSWFTRQEEWRSRCLRVLAGLDHVNQEAPLPGNLGRRLYGSRLKASVSRLEKFAACPFAHFLSHGLKLKERGLFRLAAPDLGQFFHEALRMFAERVQDRSLDWAQLTGEQAAAMTEEIVRELAPRLQNEILLSSARHRYFINKLKRIVHRAVLTLMEHARRGGFRPVAMEMGFGDYGPLPSLDLDLGKDCRMEMSGRIDRIDAAREGDRLYLRVIDYKSGETDLKIADIFQGLKLQLLTYLDVALRSSELLVRQPALPAGMMYFAVRDPLVSSPGPLPAEQADKNLLKQLKMKGLLLADPLVIAQMDNQIKGYSELLPVALNKEGQFYGNSRVITLEQFAGLRQYLLAKLREIGRQMVAGQVQISPYQKGGEKSCRFCPFRAVCQFDPALEENFFRLFTDPEDEILWPFITGGSGGDSAE
nr:helicase-exonuclease AddAB subunit AddB [Desulforamulus ruminis]